MRGGNYAWSDDYGLTWHDLEGIPESIRGEVYQPCIKYLGDRRFACIGHYGYDDPIEKGYENYLTLHMFCVETSGHTKDTKMSLIRNYNKAANKWANIYTVTLTCDSKPVQGKEIEVWYVERDKPGYDSYNRNTLDNRMKMGGKLIRVITDNDGKTQVSLSQFDSI